MKLRAGSIPGLIAAGGALGAVAVYLMVINSDGEDELTSSRVTFVASSIAAAALLAAAGAFVQKPLMRFAILALAALLLVVFTLLGAMSIGILLLLPTVLASRSAVQASKEIPQSTAWAVALGGLVSVLAVVTIGLSGTS